MMMDTVSDRFALRQGGAALSREEDGPTGAGPSVPLLVRARAAVGEPDFVGYRRPDFATKIVAEVMTHTTIQNVTASFQFAPCFCWAAELATGGGGTGFAAGWRCPRGPSCGAS